MSRRRKVYVKSFHPSRYASHATTFRIDVAVSRETHSRSHGYYACASVSKTGSKRQILDNRRGGCAFGPAPRRAAANALKRLASNMAKRRSAFRGSP